MQRRTITLAAISTLTMAAAGCATVGAGSADGLTATADLRNAQGASVATATLVQDGDDVEITINATNLPPGIHGFHLHETGTCTPPDFTSAGGHFAPASRRHGFQSPNGPHAGDLPNLEVAADGTARVTVDNQRVTLTEGPTSLLDADGTALVIHQGPDDYRTDPSGNSGARIACGVVTR